MSNKTCYRCPICYNATVVLNENDGKLLCTFVDCGDPTLIGRIPVLKTVEESQLDTARRILSHAKQVKSEPGWLDEVCELSSEPLGMNEEEVWVRAWLAIIPVDHVDTEEATRVADECLEAFKERFRT